MGLHWRLCCMLNMCFEASESYITSLLFTECYYHPRTLLYIALWLPVLTYLICIHCLTCMLTCVFNKHALGSFHHPLFDSTLQMTRPTNPMDFINYTLWVCGSSYTVRVVEQTQPISPVGISPPVIFEPISKLPPPNSDSSTEPEPMPTLDSKPIPDMGLKPEPTGYPDPEQAKSV